MLILSEILLEYKVQEFSVSQRETFLLELPKVQNKSFWEVQLFIFLLRAK